MRILIGMSGGLDSTYAAHKLISEGHTVEGAVLVMHRYTETDAAREAANSLGIPLHEIDCAELFEKQVVENFISEYLSGRTPNPCVVCNSDVKFFALYSYAKSNGFDMIATGHYASISSKQDEKGVLYSIVRAKDSKKDQTYMLWRLPQNILSSLLFPLSDIEKSEAKADARNIGLASVERGESQEICFIPDNDYASFIENRRGVSPKGNFIDNDGKILGEHKGIIRYTVGQRKGLGIAMGERVFVTKIDPLANTVTLSADDSYANRIEISGIVFSGKREPKPGEEMILAVKVRYLAPPVEAVFSYLGNGRGTARLSSSVRAVTLGQSAVFYDGNELALGGFIDKATLEQS